MKTTKYSLVRQRLNLPVKLPRELEFRIAETQQEYIESARILYECYREMGYTAESAQGLRLTPYHLLPSTTVILALWNQEIIGTISLIRDNPLGLPLETVFDVSHLRAHHQVLCEVSSLSIKKEFRGKSGQIFHPLIQYVWNYALRYFGVDYFVIAVNPSMQELYEAVYLFEPLNQKNIVSNYDFANNHPAVGEFIHLQTSFEKFKKCYGADPSPANLYSFMTQFQNTQARFPVRKYFTHWDSPVKFEWVRGLKSYISELTTKPHILDQVARSFGYKTYKEFQEPSGVGRQRIPVSFQIINLPGSKVVNISENGIKVAGINRFSAEKTILLHCQISEREQATLLVEPIWENEHALAGFRVRDSSLSWQRMLEATLDSQNAGGLTRLAA